MDANSRSVNVRPYVRSDREAIRRIACETAFLGRDHRGFIDDEELLADALTKVFTDYEPGTCIVAEVDDKVVGYLIATCHLKRTNFKFMMFVLPVMLWRALTGPVWRNKTWRLILAFFQGMAQGDFHYPDDMPDYPAILHINIDKEHRRQNIGTRLITEGEVLLKAKGVKGVHLSTMSVNACRFFRSNGFKVLQQRKRVFLGILLREDCPLFIMGKEYRE